MPEVDSRQATAIHSHWPPGHAGMPTAGIASNPSGESVHTTMVVYDSLGTPLTVDVTAVLESKSNAGNTWRFYAGSGDDTI